MNKPYKENSFHLNNSKNASNDNFGSTIKITKLFEAPTFVVYSELQFAYSYFNEVLFNNELPDCVLTLYHHSYRVLGYFRPNGFFNTQNETLTDEIALNPMIFDCEDLPYVLSILVHEMAHLSRHRFGNPKRKKSNGYHCKVWGKNMEDIGLIPSNTGLPGGKKTGFQMMHYIEKNGLFERACSTFIDDGFALTWTHIQHVHTGGNGSFEKQPENRSKHKFQCPSCKDVVWGKPSTFIVCGKDGLKMKKAN